MPLPACMKKTNSGTDKETEAVKQTNLIIL